MSLFDMLRGQVVSAGQLRQEIYLLGGRHRGDALAGALLELKAQDLTTERRQLLRAVVRHLNGGGSIPNTVDAREERMPQVGRGNLVYMAVIAAAAAWVLAVVNSLTG